MKNEPESTDTNMPSEGGNSQRSGGGNGVYTTTGPGAAGAGGAVRFDDVRKTSGPPSADRSIPTFPDGNTNRGNPQYSADKKDGD